MINEDPAEDATHTMEMTCPRCGDAVEFEPLAEPVVASINVFDCKGDRKTARVGTVMLRCPRCAFTMPGSDFFSDAMQAQRVTLQREFREIVTHTTLSTMRKFEPMFEQRRRRSVLLAGLCGVMIGGGALNSLHAGVNWSDGIVAFVAGAILGVLLRRFDQATPPAVQEQAQK